MKNIKSTFLAMSTLISFVISILLVATSAHAQVEAAEVYCTIRESGMNLSCQWVGKERKAMNADDIVQFIDKAEVAAYLSVKSRRGYERVFFVDPESPQFRKLSELKKTGSISEISKAKNDLFAEIEKRSIKISDDLDAMTPTMELIKYDGSVAVDKYKRDLRRLDNELIALKGGSENQAYAAGAEGEAGSALPKWTATVGLGTTQAAVLSPSAATPMNSNPLMSYFDFKKNWNEKWSNKLELQYVMTGDWGTGATKATSQAATLFELNTHQTWGNWSAVYSIAQASFLIYRTTPSTLYVMDSATFVGAGGRYATTFGGWGFNTEYKYYVLTGNTANGRTPNTGGTNTMHDFDINFTKMFNQKHGMTIELSYVQVNTSWTTAVVTAAKANQTTTLPSLTLNYRYASF